MKTLFSGIVLVVLLQSCKKSRSCECSVNEERVITPKATAPASVQTTSFSSNYTYVFTLDKASGSQLKNSRECQSSVQTNEYNTQVGGFNGTSQNNTYEATAVNSKTLQCQIK